MTTELRDDPSGHRMRIQNDRPAKCGSAKTPRRRRDIRIMGQRRAYQRACHEKAVAVTFKIKTLRARALAVVEHGIARRDQRGILRLVGMKKPDIEPSG